MYIKIEYFNYNINCDNTDNTVRYVFISLIIALYCIIFIIIEVFFKHLLALHQVDLEIGIAT